MELGLNTLEMHLLLKCDEGLLGRTAVTQIYKKYPASERTAAIKNLLKKGYLAIKILMLPGSRRMSEFYEITEQGRQWVNSYREDYLSKGVELNTLEVRILVKCREHLVSAREISGTYGRCPLKDRQSALEHLMRQQYIVSREFPCSPQGKLPTLYGITNKGSEWLDIHAPLKITTKEARAQATGEYLEKIDLNTLEIRILLKCYETLLHHAYFTFAYRKTPLAEREATINHLEQKQYLRVREFPKPLRGGIPVFYEITEEGEGWVDAYLKQVAPERKIKVDRQGRHAIPLDLNTLEIRMLLKCYNEAERQELLHHAQIGIHYHKHPPAERKAAIAQLIQKQYINAMELPTPGLRRAPVFYEITEKGRAWIKYYLDNYPLSQK